MTSRKRYFYYEQSIKNIRNRLRGRIGRRHNHRNRMLIQGVECYFNSKLCPKGYTAIVLFGRVYFRSSYEEMLSWTNFARIVNHERIHVEQARVIGWIAFYFRYSGEYIRNRFRGLSHFDAYHNISFEREAFGHENDLEYEV